MRFGSAKRFNFGFWFDLKILYTNIYKISYTFVMLWLVWNTDLLRYVCMSDDRTVSFKTKWIRNTVWIPLQVTVTDLLYLKSNCSNTWERLRVNKKATISTTIAATHAHGISLVIIFFFSSSSFSSYFHSDRKTATEEMFIQSAHYDLVECCRLIRAVRYWGISLVWFE